MFLTLLTLLKVQKIFFHILLFQNILSIFILFLNLHFLAAEWGGGMLRMSFWRAPLVFQGD